MERVEGEVGRMVVRDAGNGFKGGALGVREYTAEGLVGGKEMLGVGVGGGRRVKGEPGMARERERERGGGLV